MAGTKRGGGADPSPRPTKVRRLGNETTDVASAMAMQLRMADGGDAGSTDAEPALLFLNATEEAVSAFDWSAVVGALEYGELTKVLRCETEDLLVDVPGAVRRVPISRCLILREIVNYLGLNVFGYGIVLEPCDVIRGWIELEIPSSRVSCARDRKKFYSDEETTRYKAMEGACSAAILHLRNACFVLVEDINYEEMRAVQKRALAGETWSALLGEALDAERSTNKAIRDAHASFFLEVKGLCKDFGDVFGARTIGMAGTSAAPNNEKVYYGGPRPPISRAEQFAFRLVDLMNRNADAAIHGDDVK